MGKDTKIEWCHHTFNPWWGCSKVSPGCDHCYGEGIASRFAPGCWGPNGRRKFQGEDYWRLPLGWNCGAQRDGIRRRVFCGSMCDVLEDLPAAHPDCRSQASAFMWLPRLILDTPYLDWLLLTKRPENADLFAWWDGRGPAPPNVWLGVTCEDRARKSRLDTLRQIPAAVRFVSAEPLLEDLGAMDLTGIGWCIVGAESGPGARPMQLSWAAHLRDQCKLAGVPFFLKQARGEDGTGKLVKMPELDGRVWDEVPG